MTPTPAGRCRRATHAAVAALAVTAVLSACGLRVDEELRAEGIRGATGQGAAPQVVGGPLSADPLAQPGATTGPAAPGSSSGPVPGATAGPVATAGAPLPSAAAPAPPGGNGGATDIGVTGTSVTFGNVSTLSGPVPGLFAGAVSGARAYFAYQNSLGGVFGRQLQLSSSDDQLDCGQNRARHLDQVTKVFAFSSSLSLFDNCGAEVLGRNPGVADVSLSFSAESGKLPNNFSIVPLVAGYRLGSLQYYKQKFPQAVTSMATLYGNVGAAPQIWRNVKEAAESIGYRVVYERGYTAGETDFTADVIQMRNAGVQMLYFISADAATIARVANTAAQQQWKPQLFAVGAGNASYDPAFLAQGGAAVEGMYADQAQALFFSPADARAIAGVALYQEWMRKIGQGKRMDLYSAWGWGQALLAVQALKAVGPRPTRAAFVQQLKRITTFDGGGMFAPTNPGGKVPATCYVVLRVEKGDYRRVDTPADRFRCDGAYYYVKS